MTTVTLIDNYDSFTWNLVRMPFHEGPSDQKSVCTSPASVCFSRSSRQSNDDRTSAGARNVMMTVKTGSPRNGIVICGHPIIVLGA